MRRTFLVVAIILCAIASIAIAGEQLSAEFYAYYEYEPDETVKPIKSGMVLHSNDRYGFAFSTNYDCYVYIFQVDSQGKIFKLYPLANFGGRVLARTNPVKKGVLVKVPREDLWFTLDNAVGKERFVFIASLNRMTELEKTFDEYESGAKEIVAESKTKESVQPKQALSSPRDKLLDIFKARDIVVVKKEVKREESFTAPCGKKLKSDLLGLLLSTKGGLIIENIEVEHR